MRITVDLNKCNDHGQCVFSAPAVFSRLGAPPELEIMNNARASRAA